LLLQGNLREFNLPNILQLVKMSAKTGSLSIQREKEWGKIFFNQGQIYYAFSAPQTMPLGERLVKAGKITPAQLKEALAVQASSKRSGRLGMILLETGAIDKAALETAVKEQIEDAAFNFFSWTEGDFEFTADETVDNEDIVVEMNVENVIMEGCRRIDEWELIFDQLGSLERVPHLSWDESLEERGEVKLTADEWRVICQMDGRRDINTVLKDSGLDRFHSAKVIYSLFSSGLLTVSEPLIEGIGKGLSVAVRGPIDIYNEVFLNTLTNSNVTKHLRIEIIDDKEVEIPIFAATLGDEDGEPIGPQVGEESKSDAEGEPDTIVYTASVSAPEQAWRRLAGESSAFVLLANANSDDSVRASRRDVEFVRSLGDLPLVVATYLSMGDDAVPPAMIQKILGLAADVPVVSCSLRDRESVTAVIQAALQLVGAKVE
jgi:hypothetical protein